MINKVMLPICITMFTFIRLSGQGFELDLSYGEHFSKTSFHHYSEVLVDKDYKLFDNFGRQYMIGLANKTKNNWRLRSELGFVTTNSFFFISYDYDEGSGNQKGGISGWLNNQKIYLGILPEYYIKNARTSYFINGGLLLSTDLSNNLSSIKTVLLPKSSPLGFKIGTGCIFYFNSIGFKLNVGYSRYNKSELFNIYHPFISYQQLNVDFGVVYGLSSI